jgi:dsDNA-specific endonuclease/ATPase MutS2
MGKKSSLPSRLTFEESEQNDALMEKIFAGVDDVPDKEPALEIPPSESSLKNPRTSPADAVSRPDAELDLHGKTREESIMMVQNFVMTCHANQFRTALIITGKGHHSGNQGPVLKREVQLWLERNGKQYLKDFHTAPGRFGGSGAIWLNIK